MEYRQLGNTGMVVSRLCFGSLTIGPLQAGLELAAGARVIRYALEKGINFIDTADSYGTYPYIRLALAGWSGKVFIASKSYDYTSEGMRRSVEKARRELGRDYIDIFLLHEQESALTIAGHRPALEYLLRAKERGIVRAVGISTHVPAAAAAAAGMPEIDVVHPLVNCRGLGIINGSREEMLAALAAAHARGQGVYTMKPLGGGHLLASAVASLQYVLHLPAVDAVAIGMQTVEEVEMDVAIAEGREVPAALQEVVARRQRRLHIEDWCRGCGTCVAACPQGALAVAGDRVQVDPARCIFCGYCARVCPDFCLKVI